MDRGRGLTFSKRHIRRQVDFAIAHPQLLTTDARSHFRMVYGPRSAEYAYASAYLAAVETFEPINSDRLRDNRL